MIKRVNLTIEDMSDKFERVRKYGNKANTKTQDIQRVGDDLKKNNNNGSQGQNGLIMRILRTFMNWEMVILRMGSLLAF